MGTLPFSLSTLYAMLAGYSRQLSLRSPNTPASRTLPPNAALWGFPVDRDRMLTDFKKAVPTNMDSEKYWSLLDDHVITVLSELHNQFQEVWYSPTTCKQVYFEGARTGEQIIVALVKRTRREDKFLPPPDKVEELKVFAAQGFIEHPGWFIAMD